jgi:prepilin peptidase CpaA
MLTEGFDIKMTVYAVIFIGAIIQDLIWQKVKNNYVIAAFIAVFLFQIFQIGFADTFLLFQNLLLSLLIGVILYFVRVIGAGDVKIFSATSLLIPFESIPLIYFYSLLWGGLFGVLQYFLRGKIRSLIQNMVFILHSEVRKDMELQPIPFTVAILLGALTDWTLVRHGVSLL